MAKMYIENLLGENEKILVSARQHWFVVARAITLEISVILIIFIAMIVGTTTVWASGMNFVYATFAVGLLCTLVPIASMARDIMIWSHHQYYITNWRVIQVSGIFNKAVLDSSLDKINDVKLTQSALGRMFGYGDIEILTASAEGDNLFRLIDDPVRFKTAMTNAKENALRRKDMPAAAPAEQSIPALLAQLGELRTKGVLTEAEFQEKKALLLAKLK